VKSTQRDYAFFYINGVAHEVRGEELFFNFTDYLRIQKGLTGTKVVCEEGDCGACSILRLYPVDGASRFEAINSCIIKVAQLDGSSIVTVEGLKDLMPGDALHPAQKAMVECHGSQCGFCTPGFVVALAGIADKKKFTNAQEVKNEVTGNLCRCTGYLPIIEAALAMETSKLPKLKSKYLTPEMLRELKKVQKLTFVGKSSKIVFEAPATKAELSKLRKKNPSSVLIAAGTDLGVAANKRHQKPKHLLSLHLLADAYKSKKTKTEVRVGARTTLTEFRKLIETQKSLEDYLHIFASPQIKNFGTLIGNVANASPIGDTPPLLLALNAQVEIYTPYSTKTRWIPLHDYYIGYKQTDLKKGEILWSLKIDLPKAGERVSFSKVSQRRDLDISCVNAGFFFAPKKGRLSQPKTLRLALGGVGPIPLRLIETEKYLEAEGLDDETLQVALDLAQQEIAPLSDLRGSETYRRLLVHNLLKKFLRSILLSETPMSKLEKSSRNHHSKLENHREASQ